MAAIVGVTLLVFGGLAAVVGLILLIGKFVDTEPSPPPVYGPHEQLMDEMAQLRRESNRASPNQTED